MESSPTLLRGLLEAAPDAMVIVRNDGRIALVNARTEQFFGYRREELFGQPVELLVPDRFHAAHSHHRTGYAAQPRPRPMGLGLELFARRKDGSEFPVEISLSPMDGDAGLLVIAAIRDITRRKQMEATLRESRELSTPVLPIRERLLIVPVIGLLDTLRVRQLAAELLRGIRTHRARVVVMDFTGVPTVDATVTDQLLQTVDQARLLGTVVIITGLSSALAKTLVDTRVDLSMMRTAMDLQAGIAEAERLLGYQVVAVADLEAAGSAGPPPQMSPAEAAPGGASPEPGPTRSPADR